MGAPGAVLSGQNVNEYAFIGGDQDIADENVTIEYLTIENFDPSNQGGARSTATATTAGPRRTT